MKFTTVLPIFLLANNMSASQADQASVLDSATAPPADGTTSGTGMTIEANHQISALEMHAAASAAVASTMESLRKQDHSARVEAFEGALDSAQLIKEDIDSMDNTGEMGSVVKSLSYAMETFLSAAPDALRFMKNGQPVETATSTAVEEPTTASIRGRTRNLNEEKLADVLVEDSQLDSATDINREKRRQLKEETAPKESYSQHHKNYLHELKKHHKSHRFQNNAHAAHKHERVSKLQEAVVGGDHKHIGEVLGSLRSKVDSHSSGMQGRRHLTAEADKAKQCHQLAKCANGMSFYDVLTYFYSDDQDPATGELDESIIHFDEKDLETKYDIIKARAADLLQSGGTTDADFMDRKVNTIRTFADKTRCMDMHTTPGQNQRAFANDVCHLQDNQLWRYDVGTMEIKVVSGEGCLTYDTSSNNVVVTPCSGAKYQKWYHDSEDRLKTLYDDKCMDMWGDPNGNGHILYTYVMNTCHTGSNQKFTVPQGYNPTMFVSPAESGMKIWSDYDLCGDVNMDTGNLFLNVCFHTKNQKFKYDPTTKQIRVLHSNECLDYDWALANTANGPSHGVFAKPCNANFHSQKWWLDSDNRLRNMHDNNRCLDNLSGTNQLFMQTPCHSNNNQKFTIPVIGDTPYVSLAKTKPGSIQVKADLSLCMDEHNIQDNVFMAPCHHSSNQQFLYNPVTRQIESPDAGCLGTVWRNNNHDVVLQPCNPSDATQQWYRTQGNELKNIGLGGGFCMDMHQGQQNNLFMQSTCHGGPNQVFTTVPSDLIPINGAVDVIGSNSKCDDLLELFHRNVEFDGVPHWEGGFVSQVCLAEGSQSFLKLDEIASKLGTYYAKKVADEVFTCSKRLYDSPARTTSGEPFPFSNVANPTVSSDLVIPTGLNLANRDSSGMIADITEPVYTMSSSFAHTTITTAIEAAETLYLTFWRDSVPIHRGTYLESGLGHTPISAYPAHQEWKNKYFRADKLLDILERVEGDKVPPGLNGGQLLVSLKQSLATQNTADTTFTGDDKEYAKHLLEKYTRLIRGTFEDMQHGYDLVFGHKTSVGFLCGVKEAVVKAGANGANKWPGTCCLTAPFQEDGDNWGRKHNCQETCSNPGPFFSGLHEEACSANGGTWCPQQTDCSVLQSCLQTEYDNAVVQEKTAFATYLKAGLVQTATNFDECSASREYFGFSALYTNDEDICDNVLQLHNSRNFAFLDSFYNQGSDPVPVTPPVTPVNPSVGQHTWLQLEEPASLPSGSEWQVVKDSPPWDATNFVLQQGVESASTTFDLLAALKCPDDPTGAVTTACAIAANVVTGVVVAVLAVLQLAASISEFTRQTIAGLNDIQFHVIHEQSAVLGTNTGNINKNLKAVYSDITTLGTAIGSVSTGVATVDGKVDDIKEYFLDTSGSSPQVITMPMLKTAIDNQCGTATTRRGRRDLLQENNTDDLALMMEQQFQKQNDVLAAKLDRQQKENEAMVTKFDEQQKLNVAMANKLDQVQKQNEAMVEQINLLTQMLGQMLAATSSDSEAAATV